MAYRPCAEPFSYVPIYLASAAFFFGLDGDLHYAGRTFFYSYLTRNYPMKRIFWLITRVAITLSAVAIAVWLLYSQYKDYLIYPWTRDGQVSAQVVQITPRVTGPLIELPIKDNQWVKKGDLLFKIDPSDYQAQVDHALSALANAQAAAAEAKDVANRARKGHKLYSGIISEQKLIQAEDDEKAAYAEVLAAKADLHSARLNLSYTEMHAPVDGYITHLRLRIGSQAVANQALLALVDTDSFWIDAFFKETLMENIQQGDKAIVKLMSYPDKPIEGMVDSIGWGVAQDDGSPGYQGLPEIEPSFDWIRLAQRIPVRVHLGELPPGVILRVGTTATVIIISGEKSDLAISSQLSPASNSAADESAQSRPTK
jgi:multidrug resistance efflux pump